MSCYYNSLLTTGVILTVKFCLTFQEVYLLLFVIFNGDIVVKTIRKSEVVYVASYNYMST